MEKLWRAMPRTRTLLVCSLRTTGIWACFVSVWIVLLGSAETNWLTWNSHYNADPPVISLQLGSKLLPGDIKEGDDVYFECKIDANPKFRRLTWLHNVSIAKRCCGKCLMFCYRTSGTPIKNQQHHKNHQVESKPGSSARNTLFCRKIFLQRSQFGGRDGQQWVFIESKIRAAVRHR